MKITTFKSDDDYYWAEKKGLKNHTEREIDPKDVRFKYLKKWMNNKEDLGLIEIVHSKNPTELFVRKIRHIVIWKNLMIITWSPKHLSRDICM